jgi:adenosylhomocysteine nucleosidase
MIYIVVALSAEARPLVQHLDLERAEHLEPLSVFCRSDLSLIVSGVGKELATTAVDNLATAIPAEGPSIWLNVGVAGHRRHDIGTAVLASQVVDAETGRVHRLRVPTNLRLEKGEVCTVSHVETRFESDALYDMEAAAFCERAGRLTSSELIQVLKIVSDNRRTGTVAVSAHQVQALMEKSLPKLDLLISNLHRQARRFFD